MPRRLLSVLILMVLSAAASAPAADLPAYTPDANASRDQVPDAYKWDLTPLFADDAAWAAELQAVSAAVPQLKSFEGRLAEPAALAACLDLYFSLHDRASRVTQYANLALATNLTDEAKQARKQRSLALMDEVMAASGFIRGEVLRLDDAAVRRAYEHADVAKYRTVPGQPAPPRQPAAARRRRARAAAGRRQPLGRDRPERDPQRLRGRLRGPALGHRLAGDP